MAAESRFAKVALSRFFYELVGLSKTIIPLARMASESIARSALDLGY